MYADPERLLRASAGEVFGGLHVPPGHNDGDALAAALAAEDDVCEVLQQLRGPWAAVHWRASTRVLTFGRDVFGATHCRLGSPAAHADQVHLDTVGDCAKDL